MGGREIVREDCARVLGEVAKSLSSLRESSVLITGGTGFVGTWLAEVVAFLNDEHRFNTRLVLLSQRARNFGDKAPHLAIRKDIQLIEKDVRAILELPEGIHWIIHAAASPDNRLHSSDPVRTLDVIVNGTKALLAAASRVPDLNKLLNISSGLVYGSQPLDQPLLSEHQWNGVDCSAASACYIEAKRLGETLCAAYRNEHRMPIVSARPFTFVGPYQLLDRPWAVNNFIRDGMMGGPIRIQGDGETVRGYMYGADMASWLLQILANGRSGQAYNVGSPHGIKLKDLAAKVAEQFSVPPAIEFSVLKAAKVHASRLVPDVTLASSTLNVAIRTDLEASIRRTVAWHRSQC